MNKSAIQPGGYTLLMGPILAVGNMLFAANDNLYFSDSLLSKSCALVVDGQYPAEARSPTVSRQNSNAAGQSAHVPVVPKLKDYRGPAEYNVKVTFAGVKDSGQPGFPALGTSPAAQGVGIDMEKIDGMQVAINNANGATFALTNGNNDINSRVWLRAKDGRDMMVDEFTASLTVTPEYI